MNKWVKNSIFYQIYPTSFYDSNHDGVGDFKMSIGPRARFDGEFLIKDRDVTLLKGTQSLGGKDYPLKIDDPNGMDIGTFKKWDGEKYV